MSSNQSNNATQPYSPAPIMRPPAPAAGRLNSKGQAKQAKQGAVQAQAGQAKPGQAAPGSVNAQK